MLFLIPAYVACKLTGQDQLASIFLCGKERNSCARSHGAVWSCLFLDGKEDSKHQTFAVCRNDECYLLLFWSVEGLSVLSVASLESLEIRLYRPRPVASTGFRVPGSSRYF